MKKAIIGGTALVCSIILVAVVVYFATRIQASDVPVDNIRRPATQTVDFTGYVGQRAAPYFEDKELMMENEYLAFYMNQVTTHFAVYVKADSSVFRSTPEDWRTNPQIREDVFRNEIASLFSLVVFSDTGTRSTMNSFTDAVDHSQFTINYPAPNTTTMSVEYIVGPDRATPPVPMVIRYETFNKYFVDSGLISDSDLSMLRRFYRFIDMDTVERMETLFERETILERYPNLAYMPIFEFRSTMLFNMDIAADIIAPTGLTAETIEEEFYIISPYEGDAARPTYYVTLEYTLDGGDLVVRVPNESFHTTDRFVLSDFELLKYFNASHPYEPGEIFIPDGSGAIIRTEREQRSISSVTVHMYGREIVRDYRVIAQDTGIFAHEGIMPVFGISNTNGGLFGIIEAGDAVASITAQTLDTGNIYNWVAPSFNIWPIQHVSFGNMLQGRADALVAIQSDNPISTDIQVRYTFLPVENAGYVAMAQFYRSYLESRGMISRLPADTSYPLLIEFIGAINRRMPTMGIPMDRTVALTTYADVADISARLLDDGVDDLIVRYRGFSNNGYFNNFQNGINLMGALGGRRDFNRMVQELNDMDVRFFPDVNLMFVGNRSLIDGFSPGRNASRTVFQQISFFTFVNSVSGLPYWSWTRRYIVSPVYMPIMLSNIMEDAERLGLSTLSLGEFGSILSTDYSNRHEVNRTTSLEMALLNLEKTNDSGFNLMLDGVFAPYLPHAGFIANMPLSSSMFIAADYCVPFAQIVLHGYVQFAGRSVNASNDVMRLMLLSAESGAALSYTWIAGNDSLISLTELDEQFSGINYHFSYNAAIYNFQKYREVFAGLQGLTIQDHQIISETVRMTEYENGSRVYVNFGFDEAVFDGVTIPPRDFVLVES